MEWFFYNIILAFIATIFGQSLVFTFWFNRPRRKYGKYGFKLDGLINDLWPLNLVFIGILGSIVVRIGLAFFWRTNYDFGLYPGFNVYFILMIIVLFLQQWISIVRMFKRKALKYMLISAVIISALSLILSRIEFIDYDTFNMGRQSKNILCVKIAAKTAGHLPEIWLLPRKSSR